jgi:hypothetical protein
MHLKNQAENFSKKLLENNHYFRQCQVVDHFVQERIAWQTVNNDLKR